MKRERPGNCLKKIMLTIFLLANTLVSFAGVDTIKVMAYNVLYYGNGCQGPDAEYHNYLATILKFTSPDIVSLEKVASIKRSPDDEFGVAPYGFADSIIKYAFNTAFPGRYAYCTITNEARANNVSVLFYDKTKFNFSNIVATYVNGTDYNTYKLYHLSLTGDSTFLYITCNHTKSGDEFEEVRELQVSGTFQTLKHHFKQPCNHLFLGDFNARSSAEGFYQQLTNNTDTLFNFFDPPFFPDRQLKYPADWDHNSQFTRYFTTSTRESGSVPNACGSGGGGKNWYDHIFISRRLTDQKNNIHYVPQSYRTIGNDGQRFKVSAINSNVHANSSAPKEVIDAIYHMSNKYPVMIDLLLDDKQGSSYTGTEMPYQNVIEKQDVTILSASVDKMTIYFPSELTGQELIIEMIDENNKSILEKKITIKDSEYKLKYSLPQGKYIVKFKGRHNLVTTTSVTI